MVFIQERLLTRLTGRTFTFPKRYFQVEAAPLGKGARWKLSTLAKSSRLLRGKFSGLPHANLNIAVWHWAGVEIVLDYIGGK